MAALLAAGAFIEGRHDRRHGRRAWLAAVPIVIVNAIAFYGQLSFFQSHRHVPPDITVPAAVSVVMAAGLESIAVYFAWLAHLAQRDDDSAFRLRFAAYAVALGIGALNYSHFCGPHWRPDAWAVSFAIASAISPALWSAYTRRVSRPELKAKGSIEDHAVRLGGSRWGWHPWLSARVQSRAAWAGETIPARAIALIPPPRWLRGSPDHEPASADPAVIRAGKTPSPAPGAGSSRRRATVAPSRAARGPELATARDHELIQWLAGLDPAGWPGRNKFADDPRLADRGSQATRRRIAGRIIAAARAGGNGNSGADHVDGDRA